jgi:hypothetical protein
MDLVNFAGRIAVAVSCMVVILVVGLLILAGICMAVGAVESATHPQSPVQVAQDYQNLSERIDAGAAGIAHAVPTMPGK